MLCTNYDYKTNNLFYRKHCDICSRRNADNKLQSTFLLYKIQQFIFTDKQGNERNTETVIQMPQLSVF